MTIQIPRCSKTLFVLAASVALIPPVFGQGNDDPDGFVIEEIIVTAQKREERLMDVPLSISAFTDSALADVGAVSLADFLQTAPGVGIVDSEGGTQNIQIRGISSVAGNATVGYYLDELPFSYIGLSRVPDVRTYDVERVEILRGPQGTLYGDGSIGGTIRILTKEPELDRFAAGFDLMGSSTTDGDSNSALNAMVNIPLSEGTSAFRMVASVEDYGGWVDNVASGVDDQNERDITDYRAKFRYMPNDDLDMVFSAWHSEQDTIGNTLATDDRTTVDQAPTVDTEYDVYSATIRYSFDSMDLVSATSLMDFDETSTTFIPLAPGFAVPFFNPVQTETFSQELRLASTSPGNFRWTAGFIYRDMDQNSISDIPDLMITQDQTFESESWAVFGEATWTLMEEKLDLTLGLRYFEDDAFNSEVIDEATLAIVQTIDPNFTGTVDQSFDSTNPRLNLSYRANDDWIVYGNIAKGFRTGQSQPVITLLQSVFFGVNVPTGIDPETMWSYEVGTKGTFMDGRAQLEAAVYHNDWEDLQVLVVVNPPVRGLVNGGDATTQGIELGLTLLPMEDLQLRFTGGYTDAEFTEPVAGINIADGDRIPNVPEFTLSAAATYRWPVFNDSLQGFLYAGAQYASDRTDTVNFAKDSDETTVVDFRIGVEGEVWSGYLFADNLTDEDGALAPYFQGGAGPALRYRPRTIGAKISASF
ncbi:MAG: TonB-dependent receptor [Xanthomonadales bacterium]|nr:TonB-dependent receptor [Xanthomonadales bacterium]